MVMIVAQAFVDPSDRAKLRRALFQVSKELKERIVPFMNEKEVSIKGNDTKRSQSKNDLYSGAKRRVPKRLDPKSERNGRHENERREAGNAIEENASERASAHSARFLADVESFDEVAAHRARQSNIEEI